jgi:dienelactone hydrolase
MRNLVALFLLALLGASLSAQERKPGDAMIEKYLAAETDRLSQKFLDGAKTLDDWQQKRPRLHREYLDMLGLWPLPDKTPLHATVTGSLEKYGVIVEKLHYQSKPGLYVTANLYRPKTVTTKLPAIVYVCGHSGRGRDGNKTAFQDHGFWFANNGYVCLVLDTLQLGEIAGIHHGTYGIRHGKEPAETRFWWHSAGYTPAGVECWNGVRGIDYLLTRPEVDAQRIGVTGISGGGAATFWIAAADERVKVAVPVSGMSDLESYVKNKVINGHCDCMFLYNTYQWEWTTIAALVAPRPMLFANSDDDKIFPMDANRRIITKLRQLYTVYRKADLVDEYVSKGGHAYRPDLRVAVFKFLNKHLKGDTTTPVEDCEQYKEIPGKELRVFPEDSDIPKDALNAKIDESFVPRRKVELPEEGKFAEWKEKLLTELDHRSLHIKRETIEPAESFSKIRPFNYLTLFPGAQSSLGKHDTGNPNASFGTLVVTTQDAKRGLQQKMVEGGWGIGAYVVLPRGEMPKIGNRDWTTNSPPNFVLRSHALLGQTVDRGKVLDIIGAIRTLKKHHDQPVTWRLAGSSSGAILVTYAALFELSVKEVIIIDPPKSHQDGPHFLGILRVLDIPDALGLLAPTPLTIIGGNDPAFDRTAEIYRRAGAADKLRRK